MPKTKLIICILLVGLIFSSCQKNHRSYKKIEFNKWNEVSSWKLTGKIAINGGNESGSGKISWKTANNETLAQFKAPLGRGNWEINENNEGAKLVSSNTGISRAANAETLISNELGWKFPWENLHYWLRGFTPNEKIKIHNKAIKTLNDDGWEISYQKWMMTPIGLLPKKINATKPPYSVKLAIYEWEIK